jgi:integrase
MNRDIDIKNRILHVRRSVKYFRKRKDGEIVSGMELTAGIPKTKSSIRNVPLNYVALEMIKELREERYFGYDSPLLCKSDGSFTNPNELGSRFKEFQIACGINEPKTLHALRHTFATNLINGLAQQDGHIERLTVKQVADILGHTTTEITERYYVKRDNSRMKGLTNQFEL